MNPYDTLRDNDDPGLDELEEIAAVDAPLANAVAEAWAAVYGDSNDAEIESFRQALDMAIGLLLGRG